MTCEIADVFEQSVVKARKEFRCQECRRRVVAGEKYSRVSMFFDGHWERWKVCLRCERVRDALDQHAAYPEERCGYGGLREELREHNQQKQWIRGVVP